MRVEHAFNCTAERNAIGKYLTVVGSCPLLEKKCFESGFDKACIVKAAFSPCKFLDPHRFQDAPDAASLGLLLH